MGSLPVGSLCQRRSWRRAWRPREGDRGMARVLGVWWRDARPGGRQAGWRCYRAGQAPRTSARAASRKPLAPARSSRRLIPSPVALVEQGLLEGLAARREPGSGQGELPGRLGAARQVAVRARRPSAARPPRPSRAPGCGARAPRGRHGRRSRRRRSCSGTGCARQLGDQVGRLAQLLDRRRRRRRAPGRSRRRARRAASPPVSVLDQAWTAVARSAPPCGDPSVASMPDALQPGLAVASLQLDQGQPGHDPTLGVGDQVDRHARSAGGDLLDQVGEPAARGPEVRPGSRGRRSRTPGSTRSRSVGSGTRPPA